jgi:FkbM family methyltransferase
MKTNTKQFLKSTLLPLIAVRLGQPLYGLLYRLSLLGMNIGGGSAVANSGEQRVLSYAAKVLSRRPELIVMDVGANVGDWTLAAASAFGNGAQFYCFEPSARTRESLVQNLTGLHRVTICPVGAGAVSEALPLFRPEQSGCASLYRRTSHSGLVSEVVIDEKVEIVRLDEFCDRQGIDSIDFLKMDIEGHEYAALSGCGAMLTQGRIRFVQFEFGGCNIDSRTYFHDFWEMLSPSYRIYRILPGSLWELSAYHETMEVFTTTNFVAIARNIS